MYLNGIFSPQIYQYLINWLICQFCHLPEKCKYCFIGIFFTIFENILVKPTKFPFQRRITRPCSVCIAKMAAIKKKCSDFLGAPGIFWNLALILTTLIFLSLAVSLNNFVEISYKTWLWFSCYIIFNSLFKYFWMTSNQI